MRGPAAPLLLVLARLRRRPRRWLLPALGIAVAAAFATGVAAEGTIAADQSARSTLAGLSPVDRSVRVTWQGAASPAVAREARRMLDGLGLGTQTEVVLLNPVRLRGLVVRPAAIAPLSRWFSQSVASALGPCRAEGCPMLNASPARVPASLGIPGARIRVARVAPLGSAVPLAFSPVAAGGPPVLVTGDANGLGRLPGLSGIYRTYSWVAPLGVASLHAWQLRAVEDRLQKSQAELQASEGLLTLSGPFDGLDHARGQAAAAPRRLLLAGSGAVAALALFVVLAGAGLRRDQLADVERLRRAGARTGQCALFVVAESSWLTAAALLAGGAAGILGAAIVADSAGEPVGGVLAHSVLTPDGAAALLGAWLVATGFMTASVLAQGERVIDVLALVAVAVLVAGLALSAGSGAAIAVLVAPLCCLAAGVVTFRTAGALLRGGERLAQDAPLRWRLALVGLARAPALPSAAIAFIAVSVGLGGFALAYRATLIRGAADQAADRVPLDATVSAGPDFSTPLQLASLQRWHELSRGRVFAIRRTDANFAGGSGTVTVPALGVPVAGLALLHGWRAGDGSASLAILARRLASHGTVRVAGPSLPAQAARLSLRASSSTGPVVVAADLRNAEGVVTQLALGTAGSVERALRARLPPGRWELEAFQLSEPTGLEATNGHQNAESPGGAAQQQSVVRLGPVVALSAGGRALLSSSLGSWRAVGAAAPTRPGGGGARAPVAFAATGEPGIVRPVEPSDRRAVPVLVDPQTAAAAGPRGRLAMMIDGLPVVARVVGVLRRFPTLPADAAGFVVADQPTLSSALDAQLPGQGRPDELWIAGSHLAGLRRDLGRPPLAQLSSAFRADVEHGLTSAPVARGVLGALVAAAVVAAALAVLGLLASLLGPGRDPVVERDLEAQGVAPRALRADLRARLAVASAAGVCVGLLVAALLVRVAVAAVRAGATVGDPRPALVAIVPPAGLVAWGVGVGVVLLLSGSLAVRALR